MACFKRVGKLQVAQQDVLDDDAARLHLRLQVRQNLLRDGLAGVGVERAREVGRRHRANRRAEVRHQQDVAVFGADPLIHLGGARRVEVIEHRGLEPHDQSLLRGHRRPFLHFQRLDVELVNPRQRIHRVYPFAHRRAGHAAEDGDHAHVAGPDAGHRVHGENREHHHGEQPETEGTDTGLVFTAGRRKIEHLILHTARRRSTGHSAGLCQRSRRSAEREADRSPVSGSKRIAPDYFRQVSPLTA